MAFELSGLSLCPSVVAQSNVRRGSRPAAERTTAVDSHHRAGLGRKAAEVGDGMLVKLEFVQWHWGAHGRADLDRAPLEVFPDALAQVGVGHGTRVVGRPGHVHPVELVSRDAPQIGREISGERTLAADPEEETRNHPHVIAAVLLRILDAGFEGELNGHELAEILILRRRRGPRRSPRPWVAQAVSLVGHLVVAEAQHVADLVDDGVSDLADGLAARLAKAQDRTAEDGDLGGQVRGHRVALEEGHTAKDAEELLLVGRVRQVVVIVRRLVLDNDDDVLQVLAKVRGNGGEGFLDVGLEVARGDAGTHAPWGRRNSLSKLAVVSSATTGKSTPLTSASFFAVSTT